MLSEREYIDNIEKEVDELDIKILKQNKILSIRRGYAHYNYFKVLYQDGEIKYYYDIDGIEKFEEFLHKIKNIRKRKINRLLKN